MESGNAEKRKFKVMVNIGEKKREYLWRCRDEAQCELWVKDLNHRVQHAKNVLKFLSNDAANLN